MQCCPMDTEDTDSAGDLRPVCTCEDDCDCMCLDCSCVNWGEEYGSADGQDCQAIHCPPSATQDCQWPRCADTM